MPRFRALCHSLFFWSFLCSTQQKKVNRKWTGLSEVGITLAPSGSVVITSRVGMADDVLFGSQQL